MSNKTVSKLIKLATDCKELHSYKRSLHVKRTADNVVLEYSNGYFLIRINMTDNDINTIPPSLLMTDMDYPNTDSVWPNKMTDVNLEHALWVARHVKPATASQAPRVYVSSDGRIREGVGYRLDYIRLALDILGPTLEARQGDNGDVVFCNEFGSMLVCPAVNPAGIKEAS